MLAENIRRGYRQRRRTLNDTPSHPRISCANCPCQHAKRHVTVKSRLKSAGVGASTESVEVDRIPELQTELDPVLIDIHLPRRRSPGTLIEKRVPSKDADKACNLIGRPETQ